MDVTEKDIDKALTDILRRVEAEYQTMSEVDLEQCWYFQYDSDRSIAFNMYLFYDRLSLYAGSCRRWEEIHNGTCCVVERVRDKYIIPKIKEFEQILRERMN